MKYNDNGEYKDIYVKAFDTLPIGTEVDYDGSVAPSGWTQVNTLVWENENPTSSFASQDITLDDTYDRICVVYERSTSEVDRFLTNTIYKGTDYTQTMGMSDNKLVSRQTKLNGKKVSFGNGQIFNTYGSSPTSDGTKVVPIKIYGYKE